MKRIKHTPIRRKRHHDKDELKKETEIVLVGEDYGSKLIKRGYSRN